MLDFGGVTPSLLLKTGEIYPNISQNYHPILWRPRNSSRHGEICSVLALIQGGQVYLEDGLPVDGSVVRISHEWPFGRGVHNPILRGIKRSLTMVIKHLVTGMIIQVMVNDHSSMRCWTFQHVVHLNITILKRKVIDSPNIHDFGFNFVNRPRCVQSVRLRFCSVSKLKIAKSQVSRVKQTLGQHSMKYWPPPKQNQQITFPPFPNCPQGQFSPLSGSFECSKWHWECEKVAQYWRTVVLELNHQHHKWCRKPQFFFDHVEGCFRVFGRPPGTAYLWKEQG